VHNNKHTNKHVSREVLDQATDRRLIVLEEPTVTGPALPNVECGWAGFSRIDPNQCQHQQCFGGDVLTNQLIQRQPFVD
jgi:hypothetical protein